jgi:hypothetical protein
MAEVPQLKAWSERAVGTDHIGSERVSSSSFDRNQVMPAACLVCLAYVSMRWPR